MAFLDLSAANPALKEYYDAQKVQLLSYANNPWMAMVPKDEETGGKYYPQPVIFGVSQGRSSTFANAQGNQTAAALAEFAVNWKKDYSIATIDNQTLETSQNDKQSFLRMATLLIDAAMRSCAISVASSLFRSGTGTIATVSTIATGVITLVNPADVVQFEVGQTLQANQTDGGTPRAALGYVINRSIRNGTITVSATALGGPAGSPASWAASDSLLVQGDNNSKPSGLIAWLPLTDPTSTDNFYQVNRSFDYRLFGVQYDGSGQTIEEALIDHSLLLAREGAVPETYVTNFGSYAALVKALGTRRQYVDIDGPADIGFRGINVDGATGPIKCFGDRSCPPLKGFLLQMDTWKMISLGAMPKILRYEDRLEMLRVGNSDAAETRIGGYYNLVTNAPGWNGQTNLPA